MRNQLKDKELIKNGQNDKDYSKQNLHGSDKKYSVICSSQNFVIHNQLDKQVIKWYHNASCHPKHVQS